MSLYDRENLDQTDSKIVAEVETAIENILDNDAIRDYLESQEFIGPYQGKLFKEWVEPYMKFLRSRGAQYICHWIIDVIDQYPPEDEIQIKPDKSKMIGSGIGA